MIASLELEYLPRAAYVSAVSVPMASYLRDTYGLPHVAVWHNCFPAGETRGVLPPTARPRSATTELAWLSATIGPGRGLEDVFAAMHWLPTAVRLHSYRTPSLATTPAGSRLTREAYSARGGLCWNLFPPPTG